VTKRKVEVCVSNLDLGAQIVWDHVTAHFPDVRLKRWGCLGYCHRCIHVPYVLIDDTLYIEAASAEELWEQVKEELAGKDATTVGETGQTGDGGA
jgi:uncharacterized protein YuzB (UPF0349 family)